MLWNNNLVFGFFFINYCKQYVIHIGEYMSLELHFITFKCHIQISVYQQKKKVFPCGKLNLRHMRILYQNIKNNVVYTHKKERKVMFMEQVTNVILFQNFKNIRPFCRNIKRKDYRIQVSQFTYNVRDHSTETSAQENDEKQQQRNWPFSVVWHIRHYDVQNNLHNRVTSKPLTKHIAFLCRYVNK